jgi:hypothetical protein
MPALANSAGADVYFVSNMSPSTDTFQVNDKKGTAFLSKYSNFSKNFEKNRIIYPIVVFE